MAIMPIWENNDADRDGTVANNWDLNQVPVDNDSAIFNNAEVDISGGALPDVMPAVALNVIEVNAAYTLAGGVAGDLTDFTGGGTASWSTFSVVNVELLTPGGAEILSGSTLTGSLGSILNSATPVTTAGDCSINWNSSDFNIKGGLNAGADTIAHSNGPGSTLTCDVTGPLDLGAVADTGVAVDINGGGITVTPGADVYCGDLTRTLGAIATTAFTFFVSGDVCHVDGTGNPIIQHDASGSPTLDWNTSGDAILDYSVVGAGTVTLIGNSVARKMSSVVGSEVALAGFEFKIFAPTVNDFCDIQDEVTGAGTFTIQLGADHSNAGRISAPDVSIISSDDELTQTGPVNSTTLEIKGSGATTDTSVIMSGGGTLGAVTLGGAGANDQNGLLSLSGVYSLTSLGAGNAANLGNTFGSIDGTVQITNAFDTTYIKTITSGDCTITAPSVTIDSDMASNPPLDNNTTWTLTGNTTINANLEIKQTVGITTLNLADNNLTLKVGGSFTHTAGVFTSTTDFASTINAKGQTLTGITASKEMYVVNGIDGGGNTKLNFVAAAGGILGRNNTVGAILN